MTTIFIPYVAQGKKGQQGIYEGADGKWTVCEGEETMYCYQVENRDIAIQRLNEMRSSDNNFSMILCVVIVLIVGVLAWVSFR